MSQCARRDGCGSRSSRAVGSFSWSSPVRARSWPRPPAVRAARPATGSGGAIRRAAGLRLLDRPPVPRRQPRRLSRRARGSEILAAREYANAGPGDRRRASSGCRPRPSGRCCAVMAVSRLARTPTAGRCRATSAQRPGRARARRHQEARPLLDRRQARSYGDGLTPQRGAPAGSTCTSRSTTTRGSPTPSCSRRESPTDCVALPPPRRRLVRRARHRDRARAQRQRQRLPLPRLGGRLRRARDRNAATPAPAARRPTARPRRSSRRCCANGPTASPTRPAPTAPGARPATSAGTTDTDRTARSAVAHRSAASHRSVGPTPSRRTRMRNFPLRAQGWLARVLKSLLEVSWNRPSVPPAAQWDCEDRLTEAGRPATRVGRSLRRWAGPLPQAPPGLPIAPPWLPPAHG